jgi:hypothetical protein
MSMTLSVPAPARGLLVGIEDGGGAVRPGRARGEPREAKPAVGVACRDVIDEVRNRMAVRGYHWE